MQKFFIEHIKNVIIAEAAAPSQNECWPFSYF